MSQKQSGLKNPNQNLLGRSVLDVTDLSKDEITTLFEETKRLKGASSAPPPLQNLSKTVALLFFEPSTRTKSSFEMAAFKLGIRVLNFNVSESSVKKGETVFDTAQNIEALKPDAMVIRHNGSGIPWQVSRLIKIPVINAGDGFHAHPTQAFLDGFTMWEKFGDLKGLQVLIVGDIAHSRVARSNIKLLRSFGARVKVCGPPTLIPPLASELGVEVEYHLDKCLPEADVIMSLRMQVERQTSFQVPSLKEYSNLYGLTSERLEKIKKESVILHPGPVNRGVEFMSLVLDDPRSKVMEQVHNGTVLRSVLLSHVMGVNL